MGGGGAFLETLFEQEPTQMDPEETAYSSHWTTSTTPLHSWSQGGMVGYLGAPLLWICRKDQK